MKNQNNNEIESADENYDNDEKDSDYKPSRSVQKRPRTAKATKKSKNGVEWTDDEVFKLITCVESRPALWNPGDGKYKNRVERTKLWNEISENEFVSKYDGSQLLNKWSNVRIQYRSYASKKTKSGQEAEAPINWKFFSSMAFVGRTEAEQTSTTESNLVGTHISIIQHHFYISMIFIVSILYCIVFQLNFDDGSNSMTDSFDSNPKTPSSIRKQSPVSSIASTSSAANVIVESMKMAAQTLQQSKQQPIDEFDTFGKYLASKLRAMDDIAMARRIKLKITRFYIDCVELEQQQQHQIQQQQEQITNAQILILNGLEQDNLDEEFLEE